SLERDIRAAIKFADEMKLKMILADGDDVQRVIPDLKKRNIPVILGPILDLPPREDDPYDLIYANAKALYDAGIPFRSRRRTRTTPATSRTTPPRAPPSGCRKTSR